MTARFSKKAWLAAAVVLSVAVATARASDPPAHGGDGHDDSHATASQGADDGHGADAHGGTTNPMESGTISNAVATLITFALLLFILGRWVWPAVLKALNDREKFIRESLTSAKTEREEARGLLEEYKVQLEHARQEASKIVDEGRRDAEAVRRQMMDDARAEADATLTRAKREIEIARDTAVKDLYTLAGGLATDLAGKILQKELDPAAHDRLIQESIDRIASSRNGGEPASAAAQDTRKETPTVAHSTEQTTIAELYAQALLDLATSEGVAEAIGQELSEFVAYLKIESDFRVFFESRIIQCGSRGASLERMFRGKMSDLLLNTVQVLNRRDRTAVVIEMQQAYRRSLMAAQGIVEAQVTSAEALSKGARVRVQQLLEQYTGRKVSLVEHVEAEILGGLIIRVGDEQADASVARQLRLFRSALREHASRNIHAGTARFFEGRSVG